MCSLLSRVLSAYSIVWVVGWLNIIHKTRKITQNKCAQYKVPFSSLPIRLAYRINRSFMMTRQLTTWSHSSMEVDRYSTSLYISFLTQQKIKSIIWLQEIIAIGLVAYIVKYRKATFWNILHEIVFELCKHTYIQVLYCCVCGKYTSVDIGNIKQHETKVWY